MEITVFAQFVLIFSFVGFMPLQKCKTCPCNSFMSSCCRKFSNFTISRYNNLWFIIIEPSGWVVNVDRGRHESVATERSTAADIVHEVVIGNASIVSGVVKRSDTTKPNDIARSRRESKEKEASAPIENAATERELNGSIGKVEAVDTRPPLVDWTQVVNYLT